MPFDGNGIYNPVAPPLFPAVSGTTITSNQYNTQILDMAAALSNCMTRDGQGKPTGNIDFDLHKLFNLSDPTNFRDAANKQYVDGAITAYASPAIAFTGTSSLSGNSTGSLTAAISYSKARMVDASGNFVSKVPAGTLLLDLNVFGAGGRDQSTQFSAGSWIYLYTIWGATVNSGNPTLIASASAVSPTLPTNYTNWAFLCPIRIGAGPAQVAWFLRKDVIIYPGGGSFGSSAIGAPANYTCPNYGVYIPPLASTPFIRVVYSGVATVAGNIVVETYWVNAATSNVFTAMYEVRNQGASTGYGATFRFEPPHFATAPVLRTTSNCQWTSMTAFFWTDGYRFYNGAI